MKKIIILLSLAIAPILSFSQTHVRMDAESYGFWTITSDTMEITASDNVSTATIISHASTSDSITIEGCSFTIDNIAATSMKVKPGGEVKLGLKFAELDTVKIMCPAADTAYIYLLIDND